TFRRALRRRNRRAFSGLGPLVEQLEGRTLLSLSINDVAVIEGDSGTVDAIYTVSLSAPRTQTVTLQAATATRTAAAPGDYAALPPTTLTFAPGETEKTLAVTVHGDTTVEQNELFAVNLSHPTNATIADDQGRGTIRNDDGAVFITNTIQDE